MARRHIYVDDDLNEKLDQPHINVSGLVTSLLEAYFATADVQEAAEHVAADRNGSGSGEQEIVEAVESLATIDADALDRHNPAVLRKAARLEMPPEQLVEHVEHYRDSESEGTGV